MELSTCRPAGMGPSAIPFTAIAQYAEEEGVLERRRFRSLIRRLDRHILSRAHRDMDDQKQPKANRVLKRRR